MENLDRRDVERVLKRIEHEIQTIVEEGFTTPNNWYAIDRIAAIKNVCERALAGDRMACVNGLGKEDEATAAQCLDTLESWWDVPPPR